jgi:hypothetical protein
MMVLFVLLWFHLARQMPLRYFAWFCLLTGVFIAVELVIAKYFANRIQKRYLGILLELTLGFIFVAAFYLFAVHVYPGTK